MAIHLTEAAAQHVRGMLEKRGSGIGLRLGIRKSGCTGFAYVVDFADQVEQGDLVLESRGVTLVVDPKSLSALDGTEVDFVRQNVLNSGLELRNPNVKDTCGCGESFSV